MSDARPESLWNEAREDAFREQILRRLLELVVWLNTNARTHILDEPLVRWFHRHAFEVVFPAAAGRVRGPSFPYDMKFGPHFGSPYQECQERFSELCTTCAA